MEDPDVFLLQLLHVICDRFPSLGVRESDDKPVLFQVGCPCKTSHPVSHLGFILLEEVEEALGTAEQWRRSALANCESHGSQHSAPGRLVSTKGGSGEKQVDADRFVCGNTWDFKNSLSLPHKCQNMVLEVVDIEENLWPTQLKHSPCITKFSLFMPAGKIWLEQIGRTCRLFGMHSTCLLRMSACGQWMR